MEILSYLPSIEDKDTKDREVIESALEVLLKLSVSCFYANVPKASQSTCSESLRKIDGYSILILLYKTYITERYKETIAVILGRFHDGIPLPVEYHAIITELRNTITKYSLKDISKSNYYIDLALVALTSIANHPDNKKHLIYHDVTTVILPLLAHPNSNIAVHSLTLLSSFCAVGTIEVKNKIIDYGIFQHFLPHLHYFSQSLPINPGATGSAIPVATIITNICALIGMLIIENPYGIDTFLRSGITPLFVNALSNPPTTVSTYDFSSIQMNMLNVFVACADESYAHTQLLLTFDILPLAVTIVRRTSTPDTEEVGAFAAVNLLYSVAMQGARELEAGRGVEASERALAAEAAEVAAAVAAGGISAEAVENAAPAGPVFVNPLKESHFDPLDATVALHAIFKYLYAIPSNELSPGQLDAMRQAALAVAALLRGTKPNPATYHDLTQALNQMKDLPAPRPDEEDYGKYAKRALAGLAILTKAEALEQKKQAEQEQAESEGGGSAGGEN